MSHTQISTQPDADSLSFGDTGASVGFNTHVRYMVRLIRGEAVSKSFNSP
jgi:hypothetical protein